MKKVVLPLVRRTMPSLIAHDLMGVQPMSEDCAEIFKMKEANFCTVDYFGYVIHSFVNGWCIYDGNEYIPFEIFIDRFGTDEIEDFMKDKMCQFYYNACTNRKS